MARARFRRLLSLCSGGQLGGVIKLYSYIGTGVC